MADISVLARLLNGVLRNVDLSTNALVVGSLKVGASELTETILENLIALQDGSDFADGTNAHTHDGRYFTEAELSEDADAATSGSGLVGDFSGDYVNFTSTEETVRGALEGIDAALASAGGNEFDDSTFRIYDDGDNSKKIAFQASGISASTVRTITMPDANVDLGNLTNSNIAAAAAIAYSKLAALTADRALQSNGSGFVSVSAVTATELGYVSGVTSALQTQLNAKAADNIVIKKDGSVAFTGNQPMGGFKLTGLAAGSGAGDSVRYEQAILASGVNAFAADQSMGGNKLTNVEDPTSAQDAATKAYVDSVAQGLKPKQAVRAATLIPGILLTDFEDGAEIDGVTLATDDRILIKDQVLASENGIYIVQASGAPVRSTDFDETTPIDEINGSWVAVQEGSQAGVTFVQYGTVTDVGTDDINFTYVNSVGSLVGGDMITLTGNTISVDLHTTSGLESSNPGNAAGQLRVKLEASNPSLQITGSNELAAKLNAAGAIASGASGLAVQVDNSTIEINTNALRVKDAGIVLAKLASNSVDENKIVSTALSASGALTGGSGTKLAWNPDGSTLEINSNAARVKAAGITETHLAASVAGDGLTGGAGTPLAVGAGDGIDVTANAIAVDVTDLVGSGIESDGSNNLRIAAAAFDQSTITGGAGAAAAVQSAPLAKKTMVAGESFAADTSFLVRWAVNGETAARVYKADKDASVSDKFWCVGVAKSVAGASAGQNIEVTMLGSHTLGANDTPFGGTDIGKAVFLTAAGAFSVTAPSSANEAAFKIGMVESTSKIWVDKQMMGVN